MTLPFYRTIRIFLLAACMLALPASSFAQWTVIPTSSTHPILDISYADANTAYAVGDSTFLKSTDGGHSWTNLYLNIAPVTYPSFDGVYFLSKDTGFIYRLDITGGAGMLRTTDGGQSWTDVSSPNMPQGVNKVFFVNNTLGYATGGIGAGNAFCKTTDGGLSWTPVTNPTFGAAATLYFLNDTVGFSGEIGIYKTTDGGVTWSPTSGIPTNEAVMDYYFFDQNSGLALTYSWKVYKTSDGGNNWSYMSTPFSSQSLCKHLAFLEGKKGYIVGYTKERPLVSLDSGLTWTEDLTFPTGEFTMSLASKGNRIAIGTSEGKIVLLEKTTAVPEVKDIELSIYPNPSQGKFKLTTTERVISSVKVYNVSGQIVLEHAFPTPLRSATIDLAGHAQGNYFFRVDGANKIAVKTVTLQN